MDKKRQIKDVIDSFVVGQKLFDPVRTWFYSERSNVLKINVNEMAINIRYLFTINNFTKIHNPFEVYYEPGKKIKLTIIKKYFLNDLTELEIFNEYKAYKTMNNYDGKMIHFEVEEVEDLIKIISICADKLEGYH